MRKPNPLQDANFCSRLFFCWLNPLFKIGYKRRLEEDDMYSVLLEDRSQHLGEELQGYWDQEVLRAEKDVREPSLMKAILKCHWKSYLVLGIFILLEVKAFIYCALLFTIYRCYKYFKTTNIEYD
ncbi:ATP-binding cassette sub-family C member 4-like [Bos taurus]|uniref:ATP-binding cassette sub-family C member 4-like n=1 Tax=Bos taurus TaxID=9913 RepID=UPI0028CBB6E7|nr:ATP-binding cassette sub-family C member 4-like [Bos taurus]